MSAALFVLLLPTRGQGERDWRGIFVVGCVIYRSVLFRPST
jgi:hypothetical protein